MVRAHDQLFSARCTQSTAAVADNSTPESRYVLAAIARRTSECWRLATRSPAQFHNNAGRKETPVNEIIAMATQIHAQQSANHSGCRQSVTGSRPECFHEQSRRLLSLRQAVPSKSLAGNPDGNAATVRRVQACRLQRQRAQQGKIVNMARQRMSAGIRRSTPSREPGVTSRFGGVPPPRTFLSA